MSRNPVPVECEECEAKLLAASDLEAVLRIPELAEHVSVCKECGDLVESLKDIKLRLDAYTVAEPSEEIVQAVIERAYRPAPLTRFGELLAALSRGRNAGPLRVALAGLVALPPVLLFNYAMGLALFGVVSEILPGIAPYCKVVFAIWSLLSISLGYASLPFAALLTVRRPALFEARVS